VIVLDMHKVLLLNLNVFVGSASVCKACIPVITLGLLTQVKLPHRSLLPITASG